MKKKKAKNVLATAEAKTALHFTPDLGSNDIYKMSLKTVASTDLTTSYRNHNESFDLTPRNVIDRCHVTTLSSSFIH